MTTRKKERIVTNRVVRDEDELSDDQVINKVDKFGQIIDLFLSFLKLKIRCFKRQVHRFIKGKFSNDIL